MTKQTLQILNVPEVFNKRKWLTFLVWIFIIDYLFYAEEWGLNALIAGVLTTGLFGAFEPNNFHNYKWWIAALIWLCSAVGVFITASGVACIAFLLGFFYLAAVTANPKSSIPLGWIQCIFAFINGIGNYFSTICSRSHHSNKSKYKWLINVLLVIIPLTIIFIFLKLYQAADTNFRALTAFINLDWISWGFLFTFFILSILLYGFFFFIPDPSITRLEEESKNTISSSYSDQIQDFFGIKNELKIAFSILISLNVLLLAYNIIDFRFIFFDLQNPARATGISEVVHQGVYALITSIFLVILLITYLFRGKLNFQQNRGLFILVNFWLIQNLFMVLTTAIKNAEYVSTWGLTHKRLGVFVYLLLAVAGLILALIKVLRKKSLWFMIRSTSLSFAVILSMLLTFNWNRAIAAYNTRYVEADHIDFEYLESLGPDTYYSILTYHKHNPIVPVDVLANIWHHQSGQLSQLTYNHYNTSWLSTNWNDYQLQKELSHIKIKFQ